MPLFALTLGRYGYGARFTTNSVVLGVESTQDVLIQQRLGVTGVTQLYLQRQCDNNENYCKVINKGRG